MNLLWQLEFVQKGYKQEWKGDRDWIWNQVCNGNKNTSFRCSDVTAALPLFASNPHFWNTVRSVRHELPPSFKKNVAWILHAMKLFELDQSLWHCSIAFSSCRGPLCTINQSTPLILRQKKSGSGHEFSCLFQAKCKLVMDKGRQRRMNRMVQDESHNIHEPGPSGTLW